MTQRAERTIVWVFVGIWIFVILAMATHEQREGSEEVKPVDRVVAGVTYKDYGLMCVEVVETPTLAAPGLWAVAVRLPNGGKKNIHSFDLVTVRNLAVGYHVRFRTVLTSGNPVTNTFEWVEGIPTEEPCPQ